MNAFDPTPFAPEGPTPLIRETPAPEPYPITALGPLRGPTEAIATATEAPFAMCAASVLAAAALSTQGHRDAETLSGTAPASLFLLTIAESGERKSLTLTVTMPHGCNLKDMTPHERLIGEKYLRRWGILTDTASLGDLID